jgi:hypothetical protein
MFDGTMAICFKVYLAVRPFTHTPPKPFLCQRRTEFHHKDLTRSHSKEGKIEALSLCDGTDAPQFGRAWIRSSNLDD